MFEHPIDDLVIVFVSTLISCGFSYLIARLTLREDAKGKSYVHADTLYLTILQLYLEHPEFGLKENTADYARAFTGIDAQRYAAFAALVHDFLETVFDLFHDLKTGAIHPQWARIFAHHAQLHAAWLAGHPEAFEPAYVAFVRRIQEGAP
jgi:hypothetical protein